MDELKPGDDPGTAETPSPQAPPPPAAPPSAEPAPRRPLRRRLLPALLALYALSVVAAGILLWREGDGLRRPVLTGPKKLLMAAKQDSVGWVSIHGPIYHSQSGRVWERGVEQWSRRIRMLADKNEVKALILDINSPGGSVGAVQELYEVIRRVRQEKKKPVVALVGDVAASGGYYLAVACDKVVAHPGSLLGSIGVIFNTINAEGLLSKIGVKAVPIKSGKLKDIGSPSRAMTEEERALLQSVIDDAYGQFLSAVAQGRSQNVGKLRPIADGRIFTGQQALALGMADALGDSQDAVQLAGKLGGIVGTPKVIRDADSLEGILDLLTYSFERGVGTELPLVRDLRGLSGTALEYRWTGF